jgi:hypothetical protein
MSVSALVIAWPELRITLHIDQELIPVGEVAVVGYTFKAVPQSDRIARCYL